MNLTLEQQKQAAQARREGKITQREYDYLLQTEHIDTTIETKRKSAAWRIGASAVLVLIVVALFFLTEGGITGFITLDWNETTYSTSTTVDLNVTNIQSLKISASLHEGSATINARIGNNSYRVLSGTIVEPVIWTEKQSYALDETIEIIVNAENYSLWLDNGNKTPISSPFSVETPGTYTIEAITNDTKESISIIVRDDTNEEITDIREQSIIFNLACEETCVINEPGPVSLEIEVNGLLTITDISVTYENTAPIQTVTIPTIIINGTTTINLSKYFTDSDGDELSYEINNLIGIEEEIDGELLTLSSDIAGTYFGVIYASDLNAVTQTDFTITVISPANTIEVVNTSNQTNNTNNNQSNTNETVNETTTEINTGTNTTTETQNSTQTTLPVAPSNSCDNPNINLRPPECFGDQFEAAFEEVVAPIKDKNLNKVARFTRFGNFIISGLVIEGSNEQPSDEDFAIGYAQRVNFVDTEFATAWIDSDNGNLHLTGQLYEEQAGLTAPQYDSFIIQNTNGLILGYFNERTGDLYLKGNIVQLGDP